MRGNQKTEENSDNGFKRIAVSLSEIKLYKSLEVADTVMLYNAEQYAEKGLDVVKRINEENVSIVAKGITNQGIEVQGSNITYLHEMKVYISLTKNEGAVSYLRLEDSSLELDLRLAKEKINYISDLIRPGYKEIDLILDVELFKGSYIKPIENVETHTSDNSVRVVLSSINAFGFFEQTKYEIKDEIKNKNESLLNFHFCLLLLQTAILYYLLR